MNLSFSTRGWPDLTWDEMLQTALEMGFGGIEVYNLPKFNPMLEKGGPFHKHKVAATVRQLRDQKLVIPCFDTSVDLSESPECIQVLTELMKTAHNAHVPYVAACALSENEELVRRNLTALVDAAEQIGVSILIKTSGIYADTGRLRTMLRALPAMIWVLCGICTIPIGTLAKAPTPPSKILVPMSSMCTCAIPMT